jgi:hypothetical protein
MGIQSFVPSGGGGTPGFDYIASVNMTTYNRTWAQAGAAGKYVLDSYNKNSGFAYFVGSGVTTGIPLGYVADVTHAWTSINIVAPQNDYISLFKAAVKTTTEFNNALDGFASFPSVISSSGNFVLPNNALPLINVMLVGGGGGGGTHAGGGGGGGVVKLTAYQAVGTTAVTVGAASRNETNGSGGGTSYFGNVYALGGGNGSTNFSATNGVYANGGGIGFQPRSTSGSAVTGSTGVTQTSSTGLGLKGSPTYTGGFKGGDYSSGIDTNHGGSGGAGAGGNGGARTSSSSNTANGGAGHISDFTGTSLFYASGGRGSHHSSPSVDSSQFSHGVPDSGYGSGRGGTASGAASPESQNGVVLVRYYIP